MGNPAEPVDLGFELRQIAELHDEEIRRISAEKDAATGEVMRLHDALGQQQRQHEHLMHLANEQLTRVGLEVRALRAEAKLRKLKKKRRQERATE